MIKFICSKAELIATNTQLRSNDAVEKNLWAVV